MKAIECIALLGAFALGANAAPSPLASGTVAVTPCVEYNSWPMIQSVGGKLVCAYSRGSAHTIGEGRRGVFARAESVFLNPEAWPEPEVLAEGMEERDYDAGNVNATSSGAVHYLAFYTGSTSNTEVRVVRARR